MKKDKKSEKELEPKLITKKYLADYFGIDIQEIGAIHKKLERIVYDNSENIVTLGDDADGLYFIDEGQATVFNESGEAVNEMEAGQYFGEYAVLTEEKRMTTVKAHGRVVAYRMSNQDFRRVVSKHPKVTGRLLKQVYGQISVKHTRLISLTKKHRGVMWEPTNHKDTKLSSLFITYGITALVLIAVFCMAPWVNSLDEYPVWWQLLPIVFLLGFTLRTKRVLEGMLLTLLMLGGMLYNGNFIMGFGEMLVEGIGNPDTASTIVIMAMVEAFAALIASAGVVSAFKKLAEKRVKTKGGSKLMMLFIMIVVCIDECLNVVTAGYCTNDIADKVKVPRESRALLGSFSMAICSLIPFSLWSAYNSGWVSMYFENGGNVFLRSIHFNLVGILSLVFAVMLVCGILPKTREMKDAYRRVEKGGKLWPAGSEKYMETDADGVVGRPINLFLPMLVWAVSSVACGMLENAGGFAMDGISGLVITLLFMFALYVGQRLMTPKSFFDTFANGIGNALMPILLLVFAERIAACLEELKFDVLLENVISSVMGGSTALIPAIIFILCTLMCLVLGSCWGMYGLGLPIACILSVRLGINVPLCLGAALAAGIMGEALCPYINETSSVVTAIGCEPHAYRSLRIKYWLPMAFICVAGYVAMGFIFI